MTLDLIVALAQIAGSLAVVVTVVVLIIQMRESAKSSRMTGQQIVNDGWLDVARLVAEDPEITRIYREGMRDFTSLSTDDQWRFGAIMQIAFASHQNWFLFGQKESRVTALDSVRAKWMVTQSGPRYWWPRARQLYHPDFQAYIDDLINQANASAAQGESPA